MGRISASNARDMYNAYASVYEGYGKKKEGGCVDKEDKGKHNCAKKVCHEQFGEGTCIFGEHAAPDENGVVNFYDVLFEHGIEKDVPLSEMEVLVLVEHPSEGHRYEGEQLDEGDIEQLQELGIGPVRERIPMSSGRLTIPGAKREAEARRQLEKDEADSKAQAAQLGDDAARETGVPRGQIPPGAKLTPKPAISNIPPAEGTGRGGPSDIAKKPAPAKPAPAKPAPVLSMKNGVTGTGVGDKFVARKWTDAERARYTARGGKVSTTAKPAPASAPAPASGDTKPTTPTGATVADKKPAVPAAKPLSDVGKMIQASQMRQKGANVTSDMISDKSVKAPAPKPQLSARAQALKAGGPKLGPRERMLNQDLDLFDVVKGHLVSEGYADTEEAALAIMANMSEEWRESIIEGLFDFLPKGKTYIPPYTGPEKKDTRGPLKKYSDAARPLFRGLPQGTFANKDDAFKAGGGNAKMKQTGMSRAEVERLGAKNMKK